MLLRVIEDFPGNYSDFRAYEDSVPKTSSSPEVKKQKQHWKTNDASRLSYNEQKELNNLESKLKSLEIDKKNLESEFNDESLSTDEINTLSLKLQELIETIEEKESRWMELLEKLES